LIALWRDLVDLAIPRRCAGCSVPLQTRKHALCVHCANKLPWLKTETCSLCQEVLVADPSSRCAACAALPSALAACVASTAYSGETERWIRRFKYPSIGLSGLDPRPEAVVRYLARDAASRVDSHPPDLVVPVPLHPKRLRSRGFNPAAALAKEVAASVGSRSAAVALRRTRDTPSQTGLDRRQRKRNIAGAFVCKQRVPRRVWLVDDVVTTGSTLMEAAQMLRRAGAREVVAVCAARTPAPS